MKKLITKIFLLCSIFGSLQPMKKAMQSTKKKPVAKSTQAPKADLYSREAFDFLFKRENYKALSELFMDYTFDLYKSAHENDSVSKAEDLEWLKRYKFFVSHFESLPHTTPMTLVLMELYGSSIDRSVRIFEPAKPASNLLEAINKWFSALRTLPKKTQERFVQGEQVKFMSFALLQGYHNAQDAQNTIKHGNKFFLEHTFDPKNDADILDKGRLFVGAAYFNQREYAKAFEHFFKISSEDTRDRIPKFNVSIQGNSDYSEFGTIEQGIIKTAGPDSLKALWLSKLYKGIKEEDRDDAGIKKIIAGGKRKLARLTRDPWRLYMPKENSISENIVD